MCCVCVQGAAHCVWCPFWSVGCESKESTKWNVCSFSCSKYIYTVSSVQCVSQNFCYFLFFFIGQFQYVCVFSVFFLSFSFSFYWTVSVCVHCSVCCTRCSRFVGSQLVLCRQTHIYIGDLAVAALGKTDRHAHTNRQMNTHEPNSWMFTNTQTQTRKHKNTQTDEYARAKHCWRNTQKWTYQQPTHISAKSSRLQSAAVPPEGGVPSLIVGKLS